MPSKLHKSFVSIEFDALLCLDGVLPDDSGFYLNFLSIPIVAADGAAIKLKKLFISPDYILGDLDSFSVSSTLEDFPLSTIIHLPSQETNDFEKCLMFCIERNLHSVLICGLHGGKLEHTLNNWSIFIRYSKIINLCYYEDNRYAVALHKTIEFPAKINDIISIIPQPKARISTVGLQWEFKNEWLSFGHREGARNKALAESIEIEVHEGSLLLFREAYCPT